MRVNARVYERVREGLYMLVYMRGCADWRTPAVAGVASGPSRARLLDSCRCLALFLMT